jgi:hypothetical protein
MNHPLDGARLKVIWAQKHLDLLKGELAAYLDSTPYESVIEIQPDEITAHRPVIAAPPVEMSARVGDCVQNLMASLDYIAWELASKFAGRQLIPPPDGTDKPSFPLYNNQARFLKNTQRLKYYKLSAEAIREITDAQPYNAGQESLFALYHLVNQDKHRLPILALAKFDEGRWSLSVGNARIFGAGVSSMSLSAREAPFTVNDGANVKVQAKLTVFVAFANVAMAPVPVERTLQEIIKTIANVIPRFDPFFL